jgi:hypothetical protein
MHGTCCWCTCCQPHARAPRANKLTGRRPPRTAPVPAGHLAPGTRSLSSWRSAYTGSPPHQRHSKGQGEHRAPAHAAAGSWRTPAHAHAHLHTHARARLPCRGRCPLCVWHTPWCWLLQAAHAAGASWRWRPPAVARAGLAHTFTAPRANRSRRLGCGAGVQVGVVLMTCVVWHSWTWQRCDARPACCPPPHHRRAAGQARVTRCVSAVWCVGGQSRSHPAADHFPTMLCATMKLYRDTPRCCGTRGVVTTAQQMIACFAQQALVAVGGC